MKTTHTLTSADVKARLRWGDDGKSPNICLKGLIFNEGSADKEFSFSDIYVYIEDRKKR